MKNDSAALETRLMGYDLLNDPSLNKGTAFDDAERHTFGLHGLLPPHVGNLEGQVARRLLALRELKTDFQKYAFLRELQDTNETVFYALLEQNLEELLPLVYTPTVGEGCQRFSEIWRKPRGLFLSYPNKHLIKEMFSDPRFDYVRVIVVTDGERILGLGDQGAGGLGISIGKLAIYTSSAGINPDKTLPIVLDVGTNNEQLLDNPLYVGWRHRRVTGSDYDAFVEEFVTCVQERWPDALLQWEDFAGANAEKILQTYRNRLCTFNDDIQSTAAIAVATVLAGVLATEVPLEDHRIVLVGPGSAGCGILRLLTEALLSEDICAANVAAMLYAVGPNGLLVDGLQELTVSQRPFARSRSEISAWTLESPEQISLFDVVKNVRPTVLIGVSGQAGIFTEKVVRQMASSTARPLIFPLSNPTSKSEASAEQLVFWSEGRALIGTGSPFPPVAWEGELISINQINNSYIFPGVGLGVLAVGAKRVSDAMFMAACKAVAKMSQGAPQREGKLLPPVNDLRNVAVSVAHAVALQAQYEGLAEETDPQSVSERIQDLIWHPHYLPYKRSSDTL